MESDWGRPRGDAERANIVANTDDDWRLPNLLNGNVVPPEELHYVVKLGSPMVAIYRAVPEGVTEIRPGDFVALTAKDAAGHDRGGKIISKRVPANDVAWAGTDRNEYYYVPRQ